MMHLDISIPWVRHFIHTYGYLGVFASLMLGMFGLPVPDESIMAFTGFLIHKNYLSPAPAVLAAIAGSFCGITLNYLVGKYVGFPLLHKYGPYLHLTDAHIGAAHRWFEKYGKFALFAGYFFPGVRHLTAFSAGASRMEYHLFAPPTYSGAVCWVATFIALGYFLGEEGKKVLPEIRSYLWMILGAVIFLALLLYLVQRRLYPKRQR